MGPSRVPRSRLTGQGPQAKVCKAVDLLRMYMRQHRWRWAVGIALLALTNGLAMVLPRLFGAAVDGLHGGAPAHELKAYALLMVAAALAGAVVRTLSRIYILFAARDVELALRCDAYARLTQMDGAFFQAHPTGDVMSRLTSDLTQVRLMLGPGILNLVNTAIAYAAAVPLMLAISPRLTAVAFAVYPPALWLMRRLSKRLYARNLAQQQALAALTEFMQEHLAGGQLVRAFDLHGEQRARLEALNAAYLEANLALAWTRSGMFRISAALTQVGTLAAVGVGAQDVFSGRASLGDVVAVVEYMALLSWPTFALGWVLSLWQRGMVSMGRLRELVMAPLPIAAGSAALPAGAADLEVEGLSVALAGRPALSAVSVHIPAGTTLGVVGPVGAGKTTLLRALLRLVPVAAGEVRLAGVTSSSLGLAALRGRFAYVPQDAALFSKSLRDNVSFGRPTAAAEAVAQAITAAALDDDVARLPAGLDTEVGERGVTLSGGQKQRVALARALLLDAPILLLDDALSAVDAQTEAFILAQLRRRAAGRTTVVVAHRLSAVERADHVLVLDGGRVREAGAPAALLAQGGWYAETARRQALAREAAEAVKELRP